MTRGHCRQMANLFLNYWAYFNYFNLLLFFLRFPLTYATNVEEISVLIEDFDVNDLEWNAINHHEIKRRFADQQQTNLSSIKTTMMFATSSIASTPTKFGSSSVNPKQFSTSITTSLSTTSFVEKPQIKPTITTQAIFPSSTFIKSSHLPTTLSESQTTRFDQQTTASKSEATVKITSSAIPTAKTSYISDNHKYYKSHYYENGQQWWFDLDKQNILKPTVHDKLTKNEVFSDELKASFVFPFYGHLVRNVTVTNKGYLFLGEKLHKFNASAQYVAPLMADFGAELHNKTVIRYMDTGDRFTVEWANIKLRNDVSGGEYSFQCSIFKNGTIVFAYKNVPKAVKDISRLYFNVRVGLSDTFKREKIVRGPQFIKGRRYSIVRYIYYYLYHEIQLPQNQVMEGSAFHIIPLPNCVALKTCSDCVSLKTFNCRWCNSIKRCSDGIDRHRMLWETSGCINNNVKSCPNSDGLINPGVIAVIVLIVVLVIVFFAWFVYAYLHPQTKSGLFLIQYGNPLKWCRNTRSDEGSASVSATDGRISFKSMSFESKA